jgi:dipeptidase E
VKLLLTSAGIKNASIQDALVTLLGKPIAESDALCIPTGSTVTPTPDLGKRGGASAEPRQELPRLGWVGGRWACWS